MAVTEVLLDETHDPAARSWVAAANVEGADFPIQNLPFGVFRHTGAPRGGVAIGDQVLDVAACAPLLQGLARDAALAAGGATLVPLMACDPAAWTALRRGLFALLLSGSGSRAAVEPLLTPVGDAEMLLPARPGAFTDFFASINHATNAGRMFRPDNPLLPNYKYVPIAYQGRVSTLRVSGTPVHRPNGQVKPAGQDAPVYGACQSLDYELELGLFLGGASVVGTPVPVAEASRHLFGVCLLNDWSARDIQAWEYQPLGPFLGKSFATSLSPWIVTADALRPFRVPAWPRPAGDPAPLPHLDGAGDQALGGLEVTVEAFLTTAAMREAGTAPHRLSRAATDALYWTPAQMIAHQTSNGCNLEPGDLYGTGTISGPDRAGLGSLLEITQRGSIPITLPGGETRGFLDDGDEVVFHGHCARDGRVRIGFGACAGQILPAPHVPTRKNVHE
ncbi:fumarylacetoacetase [Humitalea sp. 24SJ18S-53]|uniref:fumarylacetoacetase n=1 Tax=Humitalea sp. 24SJ18S-53 TaxID=3422307 RepID=UPI003D6799B6